MDFFQNQIEAHIESQHGGKRKDQDKYSGYTCNVCGIKTDELFDLNIHKATKHGILPKLLWLLKCSWKIVNFVTLTRGDPVDPGLFLGSGEWEFCNILLYFLAH